MREIILANNRGVAIVDDEDFEATTKYGWHLMAKKYAATQPRVDGVKRCIYLHQLVGERMGLAGRVDHKNREGLDCRRENLRPYTSQQQNLANTGVSSRNTSGFKGVSLSHGKFMACIGVWGKTIYLGRYETPEEASAAYWEAAKKHFGEFACKG